MITNLLLIWTLILIFLFIRNEWAYRERIKLLNSNFDLYLKLPSYNKIIFSFWIWNINKFIKK